MAFLDTDAGGGKTGTSSDSGSSSGGGKTSASVDEDPPKKKKTTTEEPEEETKKRSSSFNYSLAHFKLLIEMLQPRKRKRATMMMKAMTAKMKNQVIKHFKRKTQKSNDLQSLNNNPLIYP